MDRKTFILLVLLPVSGLLLFSAGAACGYFVRGGSTGGSGGAERYEAGSKEIERIADSIGDSVTELAGRMQETGDGIETGIGRVGRIAGSAGTIGSEQERVDGELGNLESGIRRIESIILSASEAE